MLGLDVFEDHAVVGVLERLADGEGGAGAGGWVYADVVPCESEEFGDAQAHGESDDVERFEAVAFDVFEEHLGFVGGEAAVVGPGDFDGIGEGGDVAGDESLGLRPAQRSPENGAGKAL
jgi:hypothetical protein